MQETVRISPSSAVDQGPSKCESFTKISKESDRKKEPESTDVSRGIFVRTTTTSHELCSSTLARRPSRTPGTKGRSSAKYERRPCISSCALQPACGISFLPARVSPPRPRCCRATSSPPAVFPAVTTTESSNHVPFVEKGHTNNPLPLTGKQPPTPTRTP